MSTSVRKKPAPTPKSTAKAPRKAAAKPKTEVAAAPPVDPALATKAQAVVMGAVMRKKELIERVVERSGIKKKDAKPVVEAMLSVLGDALADHRELALQPFGKVKIKRERILPNGRMMVARIRQSDGPATATPPKPAAEPTGEA